MKTNSIYKRYNIEFIIDSPITKQSMQDILQSFGCYNCRVETEEEWKARIDSSVKERKQ